MNTRDVSVSETSSSAARGHAALRWLPLADLTGIATLLGASAIHARFMPEHFREWWAAGITFAVLAVAEASLAVAIVLIPKRSLYLAAIWVSQATIGLWVLTRTVGLPFGPEPFIPEAVSRPDIVATAFEVVTWAVFTPIFLLGERPLPARRIKPLGVVVVLIVAAATIFAVTASSIEHAEGQEHQSSTGPIVPMDGHSLLSRYTPASVARVHRTVGLVVGELTNASARDVAVKRARLLEQPDEDVARAVRFWVVGPGAARPGVTLPGAVLRAVGIRLPGTVPLESYQRTRGRALLVLEVKTFKLGEVLVSALRVVYEQDGRTYDSPYATYARLVVTQRERRS